MKHVSFLFASLLLLLPQSAFAQPPADEPVAEPEPEVSDEPEPEVSDEVEDEGEAEPEPEVSDEVEGEVEGEGEAEPEPEVSDVPEVVRPREGGAALGQQPAQGRQPPTTASQRTAMAEPAVEDAAAEVTDEGGEAQGPEGRRRRPAVGPDGEPVEEQDTASRLAQANPNSGLHWALPINFSQQLTVGTLTREKYLTYNPTYSWAFSAIPRWNFDNGVSVGVRVPLSIEWTQSDLANANRYVWWGDPQLDVTYTLPWKPFGTMIIPSFLLSAGASPISRGAQRYLGPGGRLLFIKPVPVLGGLILGGGASYTYWAGARNGGVATRDTFRGGGADFPCEQAGREGVQGGGNDGCGVVPGTNTPIRHVVSAGLFGTLIPAAGWQINLSFTAILNKGDDLTLDCVDTISGQVCFGDNSPNKHWRRITSFGFSFGYDVTSYMTMTLGYSTLAFHPDSEGGAENMFFNELTQINLGLQFRVDGMVVALNAMSEEADEGEGDEEASSEALRRTAF